MIESKETLLMNTHIIEIGKAKEYGCVRVYVADNTFAVAVLDQYNRVVKQDIYPIERNLTPDEKAFMDAYRSNVADAPANIVEAYLRSESGDKFCEEYGTEYYTGLADAWGVWYDALSYARGNK